MGAPRRLARGQGGRSLSQRLPGGAPLRQDLDGPLHHLLPVYQILKTRSSQSGVEDFSPHDLRRTFATRLLGAGTDINLVRKAMGHASVLTTQRYDKREDEEVEEATRKILI